MYTFGTLAAKAIKQFERPTISVVRKCYQSNFLSGASTQYVEELYIAWLKDPSSVHVSWASYFRSTLHGKGTYGNSPALACLSRNVGPISQTLRSSSSVAGAGDSVEQKTIDEHIAVQGVIRNYQAHGHLVAELDPLGIMYADQTTTISDRLGGPPKEVLRRIDLDIDMDKIFTLPPTTFIGGKEKRLPLGEILRRLELSYCRHIGVEYMSIDNRKQRDFICQKMEAPNVMDMTEKQKRLILARLTRAAGFEAFLARKWPSEKRFGLEGCEILIPAMKQLIDKSTEFGVKTVIIGLAHRGRLNILANVCRKPLRQLFTQFAGLKATDQGSGDVKYHLGTYIERLNRVTNKNIRLALMANPSHLESTNTLVQGRTRAEQFYRGDSDGKHVMAIQLHGDASFCGQGVVYETMHLSDLPCYTTGGTIHIIVNNQIGFTTDPRYSRSSPYCTDVGHVLKAPIFHVNSDDPENVIHVCNIAAEWRATFHRDIIIDLVCYRRNGHNETDEPMFTQPLMYRKIRALKPILEKYSEQLIGDGIVTVKEVDDVKQKYYQICEDEFEAASKITSIKYKDWIDSPWPGFFEGKNPLKIGPTGVSEATLVHIGKKFSSHPPSSAEFVVHKGLERIFKGRMKMVKERIVDWSLGEAMAIGSLLKEGIHVRLSGQDVERGTFSHRHHVLHHQTMDKTTYEPLNNLYPDQAQYKVCNSSLSEYGVLGFEVGFSMASPNSLVLWEAQFGDFCNVGQCVIDQILSAGEAKWIRQCGLVMLLPHGYEGMGPEHSSARIERFLQMSADDPDVFPEESEGAVRQLIDTNWIVANCTTPANLFHIWRRQITMPFRKPLIIFSPKSLLRHPEARSSLDDMLENTQFQRVIFENGPAAEDPAQVKKLVFCTGKVYFEVKSARKKKGLEKTIAITRIEQLTPFPFDLVKQECEKYPNSTLCWAQEEPKNQGCWTYVKARLETSTGKQREIFYAGRRVAASPATGSKVQHLLEVKNLLDDAVKL